MEKTKKPMPRWLTVCLAVALGLIGLVIITLLPMAVILGGLRSSVNEGQKYIIKYMDAIESECAEYSVADELNEEAKSATLFIRDESIAVQNKNVGAEKMEDSKGYNIKIDETEIALDVDYFIANSETFNKIVKLWDDYERDKEVGKFKVDVNDICISYLAVFDNQVFVDVYYYPQAWAGLGRWLGCIPYCTFRFDVTDYSLEYVGYSKNYNQYSYLIKSN